MFAGLLPDLDPDTALQATMVHSAAGVALMGTARGKYTFAAHLKWTPVIALGYAASILCHLMVNAGLM